MVSQTIQRAFITGVIVSLLLVSCSPQSQFLARSVTIDGRTYRYRVWLPQHYTTLRRWPVILFLHGSGERGDDNLRQLTNGLPAHLPHDRDAYPAIVVAPQCRLDREWYGEMETMALAALDASIKEFRGDRTRVYLTGMSMGGAGVWYFARHPKRFAAIAPVCGEVVRQAGDPFPFDPPADLRRILQTGDPFGALAQRIGRTPVWAFHGAEDPVIPVEQSRFMVSALRAAGGNVTYTEYPRLEHNVWNAAYANPALPKWMLAQKLAR